MDEVARDDAQRRVAVTHVGGHQAICRFKGRLRQRGGRDVADDVLAVFAGRAEEVGSVEPFGGGRVNKQFLDEVGAEVDRLRRHLLEHADINAILVVRDGVGGDAVGVLELARANGQHLRGEVVDLAVVNPLAHTDELFQHGHVKLGGSHWDRHGELAVEVLFEGAEGVLEARLDRLPQNAEVVLIDFHLFSFGGWWFLFGWC